MAKYERVLTNGYLNETKIIKASSYWELKIKEEQVNEKWKEKAQLKRRKEKLMKEKERIRQSKEQEKAYIENLKQEAEFENSKAQTLIEKYEKLLAFTLDIDDKLNWKKQLKNAKFIDFRYLNTFDKIRPHAPTLEQFYNKLNVPTEGFLEKILTFLKTRRLNLENKASAVYLDALKTHEENLNKYEEEKRMFELDKENAYQNYLKNKEAFENEQNEYNQSIHLWQEEFEAGQPEAIEKYIHVVLENSKYPSDFNKEYDVQYDPNAKAVILSYFLPTIEQIPSITGYKFISTTKEIKPIEMKQKELEDFYEEIVQQVTLRTIHEIFESVYTSHVDLVVFNGWINGIDKATGQDFTSCIISVQTSREDFEKINLSRIELSACIRQLKGLTAGPLSQLAPVKPIMNINRTDSRFIESKEVLANVNSTDNLAEMNWEDFEHLVRELFAKIFSKDGSEVRVTQASRDGGVDAIAFDPDPIRGGKFVIQAKRFNNVVPVSAVRDLYGTMISEGAVKGILVTTSYFGNDSREFVKDKPISLIDGANLVHLFQEHGHSVRIELRRK